jgi:hypothetical protein
METKEEDLSARVADIERCIGDYAQVFKALQEILDPLPQPDCPPYCMHKLDPKYEEEFAAYKDSVPLEERVRDICRFIGDHGIVFKVLRDALKSMATPDCPPYCAHGTTKGQ